MQEKLTIARPYASAAFDYARQAHDAPAWSAMLQVLGLAVSDPDWRALVHHPRVTRTQVCELVTGILGARLNDVRRNFVQALLDAERLEFAPEIAVLFEQYVAQAAGVVDVEVISAFPMGDAEQRKIVAAVSARIGKQVEVACVVDQSLIGGAVIRIGDSVIDLSLRGRLQAMAQQLM